MTAEALNCYYYICGGTLLILVLLGLVASVNMPVFDKYGRRFFTASFSVLALGIIAYFVDVSTYMNPHPTLIETTASFFETLLPSSLMPLLSGYVLQRSGEDPRKSFYFHSELILWAALFLLLCIAQFTKGIYYFTPDNQFIRGPWYPLLIVPMVALLLVNLCGIIHRRNKLTKKFFSAFLIYLLPPIIVMIIQIFVSAFLLIVIAVSISALSMFGIIVADLVDQYFRQRHEIADQRANIIMLQMRPHFVYNTLMTIYYLCEQDSPRAQQVILDFTNYLRKNFNAIACKDTIPFSEELAHTQAYLAVEQALFMDRLLVEYNTPFTLFRLPPLTLQPIVENAVKHGMDPNAETPLQILIKTEETVSGYVTTVEDNGIGFQTIANDDPHIALQNIRTRLEAIGGQLMISPKESKGIKVTITLPKNS